MGDFTYSSQPEQLNGGQENKVCEKVGAYAVDGTFEREFARRTMKNLVYIENAVKERHAKGLSDAAIDDVFETTQLINSLTGLLILPFEKDKPSKYSRFRSPKAQKIVKDLQSNPAKYSTTYTQWNGNKLATEELTPRSLAHHFRNAVAHGNLSILPKYLNAKGSITGFRFEDKDEYHDDGSAFYIELSVEEIRVLVTDLCDIMLDQSSK